MFLVCRPAINALLGVTCDEAETCDGTSPFCPPDKFSAKGFKKIGTLFFFKVFLSIIGVICRPATDVCDFDEECSGLTPYCPIDSMAPDCDINAKSSPAIALTSNTVYIVVGCVAGEHKHIPFNTRNAFA